MRELLEKYRLKKADAYDFEKDPEGLVSWLDVGAEFASKYPLTLAAVSADNLKQTVMNICSHFGKLIEKNGLATLLYSDAKRLRHERFAQLLFYGIADSYCAANNLGLAREPNAGRGAVDFKLESGYSDSVVVEIKYSSNNRLVHGYSKQLPVYAAAESTAQGIYVVLRTTQSDASLKTLRKAERAAKKSGNAPDVLIYDARLQPSASKA